MLTRKRKREKDEEAQEDLFLRQVKRASKSANNAWDRRLLCMLLPLVLADVAGIIADYAAVLSMAFARMWWLAHPNDNPHRMSLFSFSLCEQEVFVRGSIYWSYKEVIQVFEQATGRFLRQSGTLSEKLSSCMAVHGHEVVFSSVMGPPSLVVLDQSTLSLTKTFEPWCEVAVDATFDMARVGDSVFVANFGRKYALVEVSIETGQALHTWAEREHFNCLFVLPDEKTMLASTTLGDTKELDLDTRSFKNSFSLPERVKRVRTSMAVAKHGDVFVVACAYMTPSKFAIVLLDDSLKELHAVRTPPACTPHKRRWCPDHLALNSKNELFVSDAWNDRILVYV